MVLKGTNFVQNSVVVQQAFQQRAHGLKLTAELLHDNKLQFPDLC